LVLSGQGFRDQNGAIVLATYLGPSTGNTFVVLDDDELRTDARFATTGSGRASREFYNAVERVTRTRPPASGHSCLMNPA